MMVLGSRALEVYAFYFVYLSTACIDHRGTPEHPARTCTLETEEEAICVRNHLYVYFPVFNILDQYLMDYLSKE
jgi:hypothetical protein